MTTSHPLVLAAAAAMDAHDAAALSSLFAADGWVRDEDSTFVGPAAINTWFDETTPTTLETIAEADDGTTITARAHGDYPQSPLTFRYRFALTDDAIQSLTINIADAA